MLRDKDLRARNSLSRYPQPDAQNSRILKILREPQTHNPLRAGVAPRAPPRDSRGIVQGDSRGVWIWQVYTHTPAEGPRVGITWALEPLRTSPAPDQDQPATSQDQPRTSPGPGPGPGPRTRTTRTRTQDQDHQDQDPGPGPALTLLVLVCTTVPVRYLVRYTDRTPTPYGTPYRYRTVYGI
jgi:hypothetical protein